MVTVIWAAAAEVIITDGAEDAVITTAGDAAIVVTTTDTPREAAMVASLYRFAARFDDVKTNGVHDAWANRIHARDRRYAGRLFGGIALAHQSAGSLAAQPENSAE